MSSQINQKIFKLNTLGESGSSNEFIIGSTIDGKSAMKLGGVIFTNDGSGTLKIDGIIGTDTEPTSSNDLTPKSYVDARVSANPVGTGSTDLTKIKIGDTVYNIPSGGGLYSHQVILTWSENTTNYAFKVCFDSPSRTEITSVYAFMTLFNMEPRGDLLRADYFDSVNGGFVGLINSLYGGVADDSSSGMVDISVSAGTAFKTHSYNWSSLEDAPQVTDIVQQW